MKFACTALGTLIIPAVLSPVVMIHPLFAPKKLTIFSKFEAFLIGLVGFGSHVN